MNRKYTMLPGQCNHRQCNHHFGIIKLPQTNISKKRRQRLHCRIFRARYTKKKGLLQIFICRSPAKDYNQGQTRNVYTQFLISDNYSDLFFCFFRLTIVIQGTGKNQISGMSHHSVYRPKAIRISTIITDKYLTYFCKGKAVFFQRTK